MQAQAPVGAEHGDGLAQVVERRLLHVDQPVELGLQREFVGDVLEQQQHAAQRMALARHAQDAAVGQVPEIFDDVVLLALVVGELALAPACEVRRAPAACGARAGGRAASRGRAFPAGRPDPAPTCRRRRVLLKISLRSWPKMATPSATWFSVSSCALACLSSVSRAVSRSVMSKAMPPRPPDSGNIFTRMARRSPADHHVAGVVGLVVGLDRLLRLVVTCWSSMIWRSSTWSMVGAPTALR